MRVKKLLLFLVLMVLTSYSVSAVVYFYNDATDFNQWTNSGWEVVTDNVGNNSHVAYYTDAFADTLNTSNVTTITNGDAYYRWEFKVNDTGDTRVDTFLYEGTVKKARLRVRTQSGNFYVDVYDYETAGAIISNTDTGIAADKDFHNVTFYKNGADYTVWIDGSSNITGNSASNYDINIVKYENDGNAVYEDYFIGRMIFADSIPNLEYPAESTPVVANTSFFLVNATNNYGERLQNFNLSFSVNNYYTNTSLLSDYPFNFNSNDDFGSNNGVLSGYTINNGTASDSSILGGIGYNGLGGTFDGLNDKIDVNSLQNFSNSFTVMAYANNTDSGLQFQGVVDKRESGKNDYYTSLNLVWNTASNTMLFQTANGSVICGASKSGLNANQFYHYTGVYNSDTDRALLYVDGVLESNTSCVIDNPYTSGTQIANIGTYSGTSYFNGSIDDVRIWNEALTSDEITAEMNSPYPVKSDGLVAVYDFDHYSVTTVEDTNPYVNGTKNSTAIRFDGINDNVAISGFSNGTNAFSMSFWGLDNDITDNVYFIGHYNNGNRIYFRNVGDDITITIGDGNSGSIADVITANTWNYYGVTYDGSVCNIYFNTQNKSFSCSGLENFTTIKIGSQYNDASYLNGSIDDVRIWNRTLSPSEIHFLFTNKSYSYSTTNGFVNTTLQASTNEAYNFSITSSPYFRYYNNTAYPMNTSYIARNLYQSIITFNSFEFITNNTINNFTVSDGTLSNTTTLGASVLKLRSANNNMTWSNPQDYYTYNFNFTVNPLDNYTYNVSDRYNSNVTIYGFNYSGGNLSNMSLNLTTTNYSNNYYVNTNSITLNLTKSLNYTINLTSRPDFTIAHHTNSKSYVPPSGNSSFNYTLFQDQSIWFYPRDLISNELLNNYNLTLFGGVDYAFINKSGAFFNHSLNIGNYSLVAQKVDYAVYNQLASITEGELLNLTALLTSISQEVVFNVKNSFGENIEGALIQITKQSDNSLVASATTDFSGEAKFTLNNLLSYYLNVSKSGYSDYYVTFNVIENTYQIVLEYESVSPSYYEGLTYSFTPQGVVPLNNNTIYDFTFNNTLTGSPYIFTNSSLFIYNGSNLVASLYELDGATSNSLTISFNTSVYDELKVIGFIELNNSINLSFTTYYNIDEFYKGNFSLMTLLEDIGAFNKAGFNGFGRFLFIMFIIAGLTIFVAKQTTLTSGTSSGIKIMFFITALVGLFSVPGWLLIDSVPFAKKYFIFFILLALTIVSLISEEVVR